MKCYKVVSVHNDRLISARCGNVEYKIGEFVTAKNQYTGWLRYGDTIASVGLCLFAFPTLKEAKLFANSCEQIYLAEGKNRRKVAPINQFSEMENYWKDIRAAIDKKKSISKVNEKYSYSLTYEVDEVLAFEQIKLIERIY